MVDFQTNLKKIRKQNRLKQIDLAEDLEFTFNQISDWETGRSIPNIKQLALLCEYFNVSADYLLGLRNEDGSKIRIHNSFNNFNNSNGNFQIGNNKTKK